MVSTTPWLVHPLSVPAALLCAHLTVVDPFEQIRGPAFVTTTRRGIMVSARWLVHPVSVPAAHRFTHLTVVDPFEQFRGPAFVRIMQGTSCIRRGNGNHCDSQKHHHGDYGLCSHHRCLFGLVSSSSWTYCFVVVVVLLQWNAFVGFAVSTGFPWCSPMRRELWCLHEGECSYIYLFIVAHGPRWGSGRCRPSLSIIDSLFETRTFMSR